jgi:hypothetical protein
VRVLHAGIADAWVSEAPAEPVPRDVAAVRAHDAVVQAALATGATPVPARFGQRFDSDAACVAALAREASRIAALLARVAGMVEMSVVAHVGPAGAGESGQPGSGVAGAGRAADAGGPPPHSISDPAGQNAAPGARAEEPSGATSGTGRAYLERRKAELALEQNLQRQASALRARVAAALQPLPRDEAVRYAPPPAATLTLAHLIARDAVDRYRSALAGLEADPDAPALAIVGPMAPYRFAELPDAGI